MIKLDEWNLKLKDIDDVKIKLDKDLMDLDAKPTDYVSVERRLETLKASFKNKLKIFSMQMSQDLSTL